MLTKETPERSPIPPLRDDVCLSTQGGTLPEMQHVGVLILAFIPFRTLRNTRYLKQVS